MHDILVKLADRLDKEGKIDLADAVDSLVSTSSRQKAPLKNLDDGVKKDLLKFIHKVRENLEDSVSSLEEFFRRLRYFGIGDSVKDLKLDRALKELLKTNECIDAAGKTMYALTYGKHPSRSDLEQLAEDFGSNRVTHSGPLEFFESQGRPDITITQKDLDEPEKDTDLPGEFPDESEDIYEEVDETELSDKEYEDFMKNMEEYREFVENEDKVGHNDEEDTDAESFEDED